MPVHHHCIFPTHYEVFCYFLYHHSTLYMHYLKKHCTTDIMCVMPWKISVPSLGTSFLLTELIILSHMVLYIVLCIFVYILATPAFLSMLFGFHALWAYYQGKSYKYNYTFSRFCSNLTCNTCVDLLLK